MNLLKTNHISFQTPNDSSPARTYVCGVWESSAWPWSPSIELYPICTLPCKTPSCLFTYKWIWLNWPFLFVLQCHFLSCTAKNKRVSSIAKAYTEQQTQNKKEFNVQFVSVFQPLQTRNVVLEHSAKMPREHSTSPAPVIKLSMHAHNTVKVR